ncbi:FxLD family lanthipeptide [Streptosporangium sp. NBC_01495]|uniref:FxLD family lanthipeptide n=1 Tax=Streptosporangium sp. NBC_01495 TaxID=2903899 RepID=UPI002E342CEA|nr:FxLD family lanthipeptide [Streptosporangium sp. NBC_01495]
MSIGTMELTAMKEVRQADETAEADLFDLDVRTLEVADPCGLINMTDDGCSSTCGACTTGAA